MFSGWAHAAEAYRSPNSNDDLLRSYKGLVTVEKLLNFINFQSLAKYFNFNPIALRTAKTLKMHCKNIRRFYGKIIGNQLPVHFPFFSRAPVNIFRNKAQNGSKKTCIAFDHIALKP